MSLRREMYNNSVRKGRDRCVMAVELGELPDEAGVRLMTRLAESDDVLTGDSLPIGMHLLEGSVHCTSSPAFSWTSVAVLGRL